MVGSQRSTVDWSVSLQSASVTQQPVIGVNTQPEEGSQLSDVHMFWSLQVIGVKTHSAFNRPFRRS